MIIRTLIFAVTISLLSPLAVAAADAPVNPIDTMDQAYLNEYHQRAIDKYEALSTSQVSNITVAGNTFQDWGGEMFLAEYEAHAQEKYTTMIAMQENGGTSTVVSVAD